MRALSVNRTTAGWATPLPFTHGLPPLEKQSTWGHSSSTAQHQGLRQENTLILNGSVSAEEVGAFPSFELQDLLSVSLAELLSGSPLQVWIDRQTWKSPNLKMPYVRRKELFHLQGLLTHRNIALRDTG